MSRFICSLKDLAPKPKKFLCNNKLRTDRLVRPPGRTSANRRFTATVGASGFHALSKKEAVYVKNVPQPREA
jgi:hypothetical protein